MLLDFNRVSYEHPSGFRLQELWFAVEEGGRLAIAGETGSGKTTILRLMAGLLQPATGSIRLNGELVEGPSRRLVPGHPNIAYLSQHFEVQKFLRVSQLIEYASRISPMAADRICRICEIDHLMDRTSDQLSGGERQRIALARLLVMAPDLLLLDEPYSNLDSMHRLKMKAVIEKIGDQLGITSVLVSHDATDSLSWAGEIMVLEQGRLVQRGSPETIYRKPVSEYVAALFGKFNLFAIDPAAPKDMAMLRPDDLVITSGNDFEFEGAVSRISFHGPYYEVQVDTPHATLSVHTGKPSCSIGEHVRLSVLPERVHFF